MSDTKSTGSWSREGAAGSSAPGSIPANLADGSLSANLSLVSLLRGQPGVWENALWRGRRHPSGASGGQPAPFPVAIRFGNSAEPGLAESQRQHFLNQSQACASLDEPRFVQILDCGLSPFGHAYQAMELLENPSLREVLHASGSLPLEQAVAIAWQTTEALSNLHATGKAHGRLRPEHIFPATDSAPRLKLSAPGVLQPATSTEGNGQAYESPARLLQAQPHTAEDDLWTLAVTLFESLTTILPFEAATETAVAVAICSGQFAPPSRFRVELPISVDLWFARALASNSQSRFRTASEFFNSFSQACNASSGVAGLSRLDEDLDDEATAQWSLPDDWTNDGQRSPASQGSSNRPALPRDFAPAIAPPIASALAPTPVRPFPAPPGISPPTFNTSTLKPLAPMAASIAPANVLPPPASAAVAFPSALPANPTRQKSNSLSLVAGALGLALLVSLAVWKLLPTQLTAPEGQALTVQDNLGEDPSNAPEHAAGALKVADSEAALNPEAPLRTINAAEFLAGDSSNGNGNGERVKATNKKPTKGSSLSAKRSKRRTKKLRSSSSTEVKTRAKKSKSKRASRRRKSSPKKKNCVLIDSKGIRRINPSCL